MKFFKHPAVIGAIISAVALIFVSVLPFLFTEKIHNTSTSAPKAEINVGGDVVNSNLTASLTINNPESQPAILSKNPLEVNVPFKGKYKTTFNVRISNPPPLSQAFVISIQKPPGAAIVSQSMGKSGRLTSPEYDGPFRDFVFSFLTDKEVLASDFDFILKAE
jgi:hypothetical protein